MSAEQTVKVIGTGGAVTLRTGTTTGASQVVMAANTARQYLLIQNVSDTDMYINFGAAATAGQCFLLAANGASFERSGAFVPTDALYLVCGAAGKYFAAAEG